MQRGRSARDGFFGFSDPFPGFGGFVPPRSLMPSSFGAGTNPFDDPFCMNPFSIGGFVRPGNLMPSSFGGTNPFDDPFFTNPFGAMIGPSLLQQSMFRSSMFGPSGGVSNAGSFPQQAPEPSRTNGPIIKELTSDDETDADVNKDDTKKEGNLTEHVRMRKQPYMEDPDEEVRGYKRPKHEQSRREYARAGTLHPQQQTFMFQSSTVTYGGPNGACRTSSITRSSGGDGVTLEESKEADATTGKATHRISRGIGNTGHALTRRLSCDGQVNTMQTLHNLNEDELAGFEESWQRNARQNFPGWDPRVNMFNNGTFHPRIREENEMLVLPSPDQSRGSKTSRMKRHAQSDP